MPDFVVVAPGLTRERLQREIPEAQIRPYAAPDGATTGWIVYGSARSPMELGSAVRPHGVARFGPAPTCAYVRRGQHGEVIAIESPAGAPLTVAAVIEAARELARTSPEWAQLAALGTLETRDGQTPPRGWFTIRDSQGG